MSPMVRLFAATALVAAIGVNALGDPVTIGNFSFETPPNTSGTGGFAAQTTTDVWEGESSALFGFGFRELDADTGMQSMSLSSGVGVTQALNGAEIDGVTKATVTLPLLDAGDQITLTIAVALRDAANIQWADSSYFALYDTATFDLMDPLNTALAATPFLPEPATRNSWTDTVLNYTVTGTELGDLGIYIHGEHLGAVTSSAGIIGHQAFYDTVRLDVPGGETVVVPGDVNLDGNVDLTDFGIVRDNFLNTGAARGDGDLSGDGVVDFIDFQEIVDNFPFPAPAGGFGTLLSGVVPEPGGVALLMTLMSAGAVSVRARRI